MYCLNHLAQLGRMYDEIRGSGTEVLIIGGAQPSEAKRIATLFKSPFPILADPGRTVYAAYGFGKFIGVVQKSGTVLIDRQRTVRYVNRATNPQSSLKQQELTDAIAQLES